eukprot:CAMPEP_0205942054 /NCGR_PEP_ID=MMETSP1325-20131115/56506_1 /ASSEMBLY_ACC=CAM_ASM_000708 /TAXON_ID=236786 /ORGANISM="Florenciella sp., Strain RCC1007" /LENGTH=69 /DNA_ID=CAMNT_0053312727 /DNA_START=394 /DNA_END=598 /DNA_ORIENTATION=-
MPISIEFLWHPLQENLEGFAFIFYQSMMNLTNLATGDGVPDPRTIVDAVIALEEMMAAVAEEAGNEVET